MGKFVTRKDDSLITYKIGKIFPSFHKKLIQTFISGLDAQRWSKERRKGQFKEICSVYLIILLVSFFPQFFLFDPLCP